MFKESGDDELTKRTGMRELQILRALRHDNIVMLLEAFMKENRLFLVFEHVQRTLLDDIERSNTGLPPAQVRDVLWQLLAAIDFCHRNSVVHRDIKVRMPTALTNGTGTGTGTAPCWGFLFAFTTPVCMCACVCAWMLDLAAREPAHFRERGAQAVRFRLR
jgi:serine/threonine protein kinase